MPADKEEKSAEEQRLTFHCAACGMTERCDYFGRQPRRFLKSIMFLEDCYVLEDPFGSGLGGEEEGGDKFIVLGSHCVVCGDCVCQAAACSVFYTKRFCVSCVRQNADKFPQEVVGKLPKLS